MGTETYARTAYERWAELKASGQHVAAAGYAEDHANDIRASAPRKYEGNLRAILHDAPAPPPRPACRFARVGFGWQCRGGDCCGHYVLGADLPAGYPREEPGAPCPTCGHVAGSTLAEVHAAAEARRCG